MKIKEEDNNLIVFLNNKTIKQTDFSNKINLEKNFQKLFSKLNNIYELNLSGRYNITIYNTAYGLIIEMQKQDIEYFDYYDEIDMNITISKYTDIIYKIKNYNKIFKEYCEFYIKDDSIYALPKKEEFQKLGILIENSEIIYGKKCNDIKKTAKKISPKLFNIDKL